MLGKYWGISTIAILTSWMPPRCSEHSIKHCSELLWEIFNVVLLQSQKAVGKAACWSQWGPKESILQWDLKTRTKVPFCIIESRQWAGNSSEVNCRQLIWIVPHYINSYPGHRVQQEGMKSNFLKEAGNQLHLNEGIYPEATGFNKFQRSWCLVEYWMEALDILLNNLQLKSKPHLLLSEQEV